MRHVRGKLAAEQHVHDTAVHAPPVVDGAAVGAGFIPHPAAVQHAVHHILVELAPVPEGRSQILQYAARTDEEGAELPLGAARHRGVAARNHRDALAGKDGQRVLLVGQAGPA